MSELRQRRRLLALGLAAVAGAVFPQAREKVIRIVARKFEYTPSELTLEKGVPVVIELTTEDVTMGFSAPDFKVDAEIVPGQVARVRLIPDKVGTFEFACDIFCGEGHENMSGTIHVVA
jgi:cytochrome c oxidase subunit 2